jgi:hypothetical protein
VIGPGERHIGAAILDSVGRPQLTWALGRNRVASVTLRAFWQDAPRASRVALACAGILACYYPARLLGLRIEGGVGNWGTLAFFPLVALGMATTHRRFRLQRAAWRLSGQGRSSGIMATLESPPPARPRVIGWRLGVSGAFALLIEFVAVVARSGALPGTTTRVAAVAGVLFGVLRARQADALARRERELARWAAAVAA